MRKIARAKKNKEKLPTVDEFLWLIESGFETSDRINDNLRRCGMAREDRSSPDGRWLGPHHSGGDPRIPLLDGSTFFFLVAALAIILLTITVFA